MRLIGLLVILTLSIIPAPFAAEGQHATTGLAFHQAVTASAGLADPAKFERVERAAEETDVYVARTAALVIHLDEITTVVITREPVYADAASGTEAFRRRLGLPGQPYEKARRDAQVGETASETSPEKLEDAASAPHRGNVSK